MADPADLETGLCDVPQEIGRAGKILAELADAAQSAAWSLAEEQKARAAARIDEVAAAMRAAARSFEDTQSPLAAGYAHCAAREIGAVAESIRACRWSEITADIVSAARRQPALFVGAATALGFIVGRFVAASHRADGRESDTRTRL